MREEEMREGEMREGESEGEPVNYDADELAESADLSLSLSVTTFLSI